MADIKTLRLAIDARRAKQGASEFSQASQQIKAEAGDIENKILGMQRNLNKNLKFPIEAINEKGIDRLKSEFKVMKDLNDRLFAATHTGLETDLKDHDDYFSKLRAGWQNNEAMLTLITKTETAERMKVIEQYADQSKFSIEKTLGIFFRAGLYTYAVKSVMDIGTAMHKAGREGQNMFEAFMSGIPILNRLAESARNLADEISGLAELREIETVRGGFEKSYLQIAESLGKSLRLQRAAENYDAINARLIYEERLKEIEALNKEADAIYKHNAAINEQIEALQKRQDIFKGGYGGVYWKVPQEETQKQIENLESFKIPAMPSLLTLRDQAKTEYDMSLRRAENQKILGDTRDALDQMRTMDYLTRTERIMNLKAYQAANADTLGSVSEANRLVNEEIQNLDRSRLDAMMVYNAELRDDMQNSALYASEKYAEAARSIEGSMSGAFDSMISGGATWRDAMSNFFMDVSRSFSRMSADMAAKAAMTGIMNIKFSSASNAATGGGSYGGTGGGGPTGGASRSMITHGGGIIGETNFPTRLIPSDFFEHAPRLHSGLKSNERRAILEVGEEVRSKEDVRKGRATTVNHYNYHMTINTPNADSFRRSKTQIMNELRAANGGR